MSFKLFRLMSCCLAVLCFSLSATHAQTQLANPGFEEDTANVGNPDGWSIHKDAKVKVVSGNASVGNRALRIEDGYAVVDQNLQIPKLAGQNIDFSIDAKGETPGAVFGVRIGWYSENGKWGDTALLWNTKLTTEYQTFNATRQLPPTAKAGRLWIGIYRSSKEGVFVVDNIKLQISGGLNEKDLRRAVALARDAGYFLKRLDAAPALSAAQKSTWKTEAETIAKAAEAATPSLLGTFDVHERKISTLNAQLFRELAKGKPLLAGWALPFERLEPDALPPIAERATTGVLALRGERQAFGLDVANSSDAPQKIRISTQGLPASCALLWRRQVFTETWYTKGKTLLADPLVQLASEDGNALLEISPGETVRLYGEITIGATAPGGEHSLQIQLKQNDTVLDTRTLPLRIASQSAPPRRMTHYEFLYPTIPVVSNHTADAVRDLEAHGVTDIEWPFMPPSVFDDEGNLTSVDFTNYDRWLEAFGPSTIRLNTFWEPGYTRSFKKADGTMLPVLSPAWKNAFKQIFQRWIDHAKSKGVAADRITILVADEIHSKSLENAPDAEIQEYVQIAQFIKANFPQVKNYLTLSYYAFPADVKAALPLVDAVMPHLPQPDKLTRNAPPTYNPQKAFADEIYPMLRKARDERGLQIWSYHVAAGRSDDVNSKAPWNRGYPLLAAATGHTGIAYWAYNVSRGSSWDDTDGGLLDYSFVYDGMENHPLAKKWNTTREIVVPSLRWEAVRAGLQDADLILALQSRPITPEVVAVLKDAEQLQVTGGKLAPGVTTATLENLSRRLREAYLK